ncbi:hypothetical protein JCM10212_001443 [Sporobolomyces blumeae]
MSAPTTTKDTPETASEPAGANPLLLDGEGAISERLHDILKTVFHKYSKAPVKPKGDSDEKVCGREGLDAFARDTNGQEMTDETYNEIVEYLDVTDDGELTFKGFIQLYQLQTENDPAETENDLRAWGYVPSTLEPASTDKPNDKATGDEAVKAAEEATAGVEGKTNAAKE